MTDEKVEPVSPAPKLIVPPRRRVHPAFWLVLVILALVLFTPDQSHFRLWIGQSRSVPGTARQIGNLTVYFQAVPNPPDLQKANQLFIHVQDSAGHPVNTAQVQIDTTMVTMDMGATTTRAEMKGPGFYQVQPPFSMAGAWDITVHVAQPGQGKGSTTFRVDVR